MTYSLDLRQRVVSFVEGGGSKSEASRVFRVGRNTVYSWLRRPHGPPHPRLGPERGRRVLGGCSGNSRPRTTIIAARHRGRLAAPMLFEGTTDANVFNLC